MYNIVQSSDVWVNSFPFTVALLLWELHAGRHAFLFKINKFKPQSSNTLIIDKYLIKLHLWSSLLTPRAPVPKQTFNELHDAEDNYII